MTSLSFLYFFAKISSQCMNSKHSIQVVLSSAMNAAQKKQYGLVLKAKKTETKPTVAAASLFNDDDDELEKVDVSGKARSAAALRTIKQAERTHELALAEDPTIFDYDASYDEIERKKNEKIAEQKKMDDVRKPKYAEAIIKAHSRRELEKYSREERQQQRERETENGEFADKEVFITGAYKEQMEAVAKFREEEEYEARFNQLTSVEKQKVWQAGLSRTLLNDIARDGEVKGSEDKGKEEKKEGKKEEKKERNTRRRLDSEEEDDGGAKDRAEVKKKSIYDSDPEDEGTSSKPFIPPHKNFSGELKPGLNRVNKKTKSERVKERMFTPSPESSDNEETRRRRNRDNSQSPKRESRKEVKEEVEEQEEHKPPKDVYVKKKIKDAVEVKKERFARLKEIVARRNGDEQIEHMRLRYLERRDSGFVTLPL